MTKWLFTITFSISQSEIRKIVYADRLGINDALTFPYAVLKLVLEKSGTKHELLPSKAPMNDERARLSLKNDTIDVAWFGTSAVFEKQYFPIEIPITQGILGYRLFVIHKDKQKLFDNIRSIKDLKKLSCIQGKGWADVEILRFSGFNVQTSAVFNTLFERIHFNKVDFLPLGANEIFDIVEEQRINLYNLQVEKNYPLVYPYDYYFFVKKGNHELHSVIHSGFTAAKEDGSYLKLFQNHAEHKDFFEKAEIKKRKVIRIQNPLISDTSEKTIQDLDSLVR